MGSAVRCRAVLLSALVAGLFLSVPLKAWTIVSAHVHDGPSAEETLRRMLDDAGFRTAYEDRLLARQAVIGEAGRCRVWMGIVSGEGWHRDIVVSGAPKGVDVVFFFRGRPYPDQPAWATWLDEKSAVLARSFALPLQPSPVVAAYIGKKCSLDRTAWAERLRNL